MESDRNTDDEQKDVAIALFEPFDPNKKPMYCKNLVYPSQGTTEFSFEEIRAVKWRKRREEQLRKQREEDNLKVKHEQVAKIIKDLSEEKEIMRKNLEAERNERKKLQEQNKIEQEQNRIEQEQNRIEQEESRIEQVKLRQMHEESSRQQQEALKKQEDMITQQNMEIQKMKADMEELINQVKKHSYPANDHRTTITNAANNNACQISNSVIPTELCSRSGNTSANTTNFQKSPYFLEDTKALLQTNTLLSSLQLRNESYATTPSSLHKTSPRIKSLTSTQSRNQLSQASPTVNTKEAQLLMQEMWGYQQPTISSSKRNKDIPKDGKVSNQPSPSKIKGLDIPANSFSIYQDGDESKSELKLSKKPVPIPTYRDEKDGLNVPLAPFTIYQDGDETKSNVKFSKKPVPITIYSDENIEKENFWPKNKIMPLTCRPTDKPVAEFNQTYQTMILPSPEDFEEMAKKMSTPINGHRFLPEEDENTCAVQIAFKFPLPIQQASTDVADACNGGQGISTFQLEEKKNSLASKTKEIHSNVENMDTPAFEHIHNNINDSERDTENIKDTDLGVAGKNKDVETRNLEKQMKMMSPILETSREYNYKSSSSSSESHYHMTSNKSHWNGNNSTTTSDQQYRYNGNSISGATKTPGIISKVAFCKSNTLGQIPEETCSSGYIADASSSRTPGYFLKPSANPEMSEPLSRKKTNVELIKEIEDEQVKTPIHNFMKEFQNKAGMIPSTNQKPSPDTYQLPESLKSAKNIFLQVDNLTQSIHDNTSNISRLAGGEATRSRLATPSLEKQSFLVPSMINDASLDYSMFPPPFLSASNINIAKPDLELTQSSPKMEMSPPRLESWLITHEKVDAVPDIDNPFDELIHKKILSELEIPLPNRHGYYSVDATVPQIRSNTIVHIGPTRFVVKECKGEGAYGKVFRASRPCGDTNPDETIAEMDCVIKVQKSQPNEWEFYVCTELHRRLPLEEDRQWFMSIPRFYAFNGGSVFVSEHQPFTLLDVCNNIDSLNSMHCRELITVYFTIEMMYVLEKLLKAKIIHADIKPENFMIQNMPRLTENSKDASVMFKNMKPSLILIDFGVSIDMQSYPENTQFRFKYEKAENMTPEMLEGKQWNYHIDFFGIAKVAYTMLYGEYIKLTKFNGKYKTLGKPKRWWNAELWNSFFDELLNIKDSQLPDITRIRKNFESFFFQKYRHHFKSAVFQLNNSLYKK